MKDTASVVSGSAEFDFILPGTYYARLFIDRNRNGKYDTGILDSIQPEDVYYYPKKIVLKKNWDVETDMECQRAACRPAEAERAGKEQG